MEQAGSGDHVYAANSPEAYESPLVQGSPYSSSMTDMSELFNAVSFDGDEEKTKTRIPWKWIGTVLGGVMGLGLVGILGVFSWPHISAYLARMSAPSISQTNTDDPIQHTPDIAEPIAPITEVITQDIEVPPVISATPKPIPQPIRDRLRSGGKGPQMIKIAAGIFSMGSKSRLGSLGRQERPEHDVTVRSFYLARYETSFDEYDRFVRASNYSEPDDSGFGRGNLPVINVSWDDAQAYVRWLSSETGQRYYLPSESQWEYAAKGGTKTNYWWGNKLKRGYAVCLGCGTAWDSRTTAPVGSIRPNAFGLYDTSGNVMEWVQDCYNNNYQGAPDDGSPWLSGDCSQRVVRGGAFNKPITSARNSARFYLPTDGRFNMLGFRVARD
jgi:formylglycine-generating enzyme required for sulfatase activity